VENLWRSSPVAVQPEERSSALVIPLPTEEFGRAFGGQVLVYQPHRGAPSPTAEATRMMDRWRGPRTRGAWTWPGPGRDWQLSVKSARPRVLCAVGEAWAGVLAGGLHFAVKFVPGRGLAGEWTTRCAYGVTEGSRRGSD
jgi:hypothetical protein